MKKSIRTHFALLFALLSLAPVAIIFAIYSPGVIRDLNVRGIQDLHTLGSGHRSVISLWIKEKTQDAERIALSRQVLTALKEPQQGREGLSGFLHFNLKELGLSGIYVFDREGELVASEGKGGDTGPPEDVKRLLEDVREGTSVRWADLHKPGNVNNKHLAPFLTTPVLAGSDAVGTVVVHLDLCELRGVLANIVGKREGCSYLIDKEGNILTCLILDPAGSYLKSVGNKPVDPRTGKPTLAVSACVSGRTGFSLQPYANNEGEDVMGAWGWLPELDAGVILELSAQEIYGAASMVKRRLWPLLLVITLGVIVVSVFIGRKVSEPVLSLTETAKKIAAGDLEERTSVKSQDELGELSESLNTMVESLRREHAALEDANKKLAAALAIDSLTGLYNHQRFMEMIDAEHRRAGRYNLPLCLLMVDIDNFKLINDTHGHPFGDFVLKELAHLIRNSIRDTDIAYRYGGEEFAVILPSTGLDGGYAVAEKLREEAAGHVFKKSGLVTRLTLTVGISSLEGESIKTGKDMIKHADKAMYEGKLKGKNTVVSWSESIILERLISKEEAKSTEHYRKRFLSTADTAKRSYMEAATGLIKTLEAKDGFSATHSYLVAAYVVEFAEELGLSKEDTEVIKNSAILHDIGKIAMPSFILVKKDKLTEEEYGRLKIHAEESVRMLKDTGFLQKELPIILHHQEWFNGEGYPHGLKLAAIPLGARLLAVCDAYAAMTSKRPYRKRLSSKHAFEELRKGAGTQFDPDLIEPFIRMVEKFIASTRRIHIPQLNKTVDIA
ncbi:MAG: diguanylate cyclase [Candidatus Brocadiales bacterium]|nr:diguanylate cyclase [Candidatus Bathyanammoxibius amoris]